MTIEEITIFGLADGNGSEKIPPAQMEITQIT